MKHQKRPSTPVETLPRATPAELIRLLIPPMHALELVVSGKTADAVASATRGLGKLRDEGLDHLTNSDILTALAELDLRAKQLAPGMVQRVCETYDAITEAETALAAARSAHARAKAAVLVELGYRDAK